MAIRFFFLLNDELIQLPVNPEKIEIVRNGRNKTLDLITLGEINLLKDPKLITIKFDSFFPKEANKRYNTTHGDFKGPKFYIEYFNKAVEEKETLRFIISDKDINILVSVETFTISHKSRDEDTLYSISLKEYREFGAKEVLQEEAQADIETEVETEKLEEEEIFVEIEDKRKANGFAIGDNVIVNGKYWYTASGKEPHGTFNNFNGKISHILVQTDKPNPYHIVTPNGGFRGWVKEEQIRFK